MITFLTRRDDSYFEPPKESKYYINPDAFTLLSHKKSIYNDEEISSIIRRVVIDISGLEWHEIISKTRKRYIVEARQLYMYLMSENTRYTLERIGSVLNGLDHSTVLHGKKTWKNLNDTSLKHNKTTLLAYETLNAYKLKLDEIGSLEEDTEIISNWENIKHKYS